MQRNYGKMPIKYEQLFIESDNNKIHAENFQQCHFIRIRKTCEGEGDCGIGGREGGV